MELQCQQQALTELRNCAELKHQSILIVGPEGVGKSYLAKQFANFLGVNDFHFVKSSTNDLRDAIDESGRLDMPIVVCIENLDSGVFAASSVILKFLEEPVPNVYVVVTARNLHGIPDTIVSRSRLVQVNNPTMVDLKQFESIKREYPSDVDMSDFWMCVRSFSDVELIISLTADQIHHIRSTYSNILKSKCVSDGVWSLQKYPDRSDTPIEFVLRYIMRHNTNISREVVDCLSQLSKSRVAAYIVLTLFIFRIHSKEGLLK